MTDKQKPSFVWRMVLAAGVITGILGGVMAIDSHYTPRLYHQVSMTALSQAHAADIKMVQATIDNMQARARLQNAFEAVLFWQRSEAQFFLFLTSDPNNAILRNQYKQAVEQRKAAEKRLCALQDKMIMR